MTRVRTGRIGPRHLATVARGIALLALALVPSRMAPAEDPQPPIVREIIDSMKATNAALEDAQASARYQVWDGEPDPSKPGRTGRREAIRSRGRWKLTTHRDRVPEPKAEGAAPSAQDTVTCVTPTLLFRLDRPNAETPYAIVDLGPPPKATTESTVVNTLLNGMTTTRSGSLVTLLEYPRIRVTKVETVPSDLGFDLTKLEFQVALDPTASNRPNAAFLESGWVTLAKPWNWAVISHDLTWRTRLGHYSERGTIEYRKDLGPGGIPEPSRITRQTVGGNNGNPDTRAGVRETEVYEFTEYRRVRADDSAFSTIPYGIPLLQEDAPAPK